VGLALRYQGLTEKVLQPQVSPVQANESVAPRLETRSQSRHRFAVQVGACEDRHEAEAVARRFASDYRNVLVAPRKIRGTIFYRVRIPAETKREARKLAAKLRREFQVDPWIVRLP
jgi:cell division protein FtsN